MTLPISSPELRRLLEHQGFVQRLARQLCLDESSAQDLEQETWLTALRYPPRNDSSPKAWLRTVMRNLHFRRHRDAGTRAYKETRREAESDRAVLRPDEEVAADQARNRMGEALSRLPDQYHEAVVLRFEEGLPPREIGKRLGIDTEQARWRVRRGVEILRSDLEKDSDRRDWMAGMALLARPGERRLEGSPASTIVPVAAAGTVAAAFLVWLVNFAGTTAPFTGIEPPEVEEEWVQVERSSNRKEAQSAPIELAVPEATYPERSETVTVQGRVIGRTGKTLANARIRLVSDDGFTVEKDLARADAQGFFQVTVPRGAWLSAAWHKSRSYEYLVDGPTFDGVVELKVEHRLKAFDGVVLDSEGEPVEGVAIVEARKRNSTHFTQGLVIRMAGSEVVHSEADGTFKLMAVPEVNYFSAYAEEVGAWTGFMDELDRIVLEERAPFEPRKRGISGEIALAEGDLLVYTALDGTEPFQVIPVMTNGHFEEEVPLARGTLWIWSQGRFVRLRGLLIGQEGDLGGLEPCATGSIRLGFQGPSDRVQRAFITLLQEGETPMQSGLNDQEHFTLPVGVWNLAVDKWGFLTHRSELVVEEDATTEAELNLLQGARVKIHLNFPEPILAEETLTMRLYDEAGNELLHRTRALTRGATEWVWRDTVEPGEYRFVTSSTCGLAGEGTISVWPDPEDIGPKGSVTLAELELERLE